MGGYRPLPPCFAAFYKVIGLLKRNVINGKLAKLDLLKKLELKSHLEKSTDSGAVITSDLDQSSQDLQTDASMSTSDKFTMYPSIPVIRSSTETKTSLANSVVVTPVVSSRNELLTCYQILSTDWSKCFVGLMTQNRYQQKLRHPAACTTARGLE